jgi:DNA-binding beta-propeller fold protein YncE
MAASYQVYVSFSGESGEKIQNVGALSETGEYLGEVLNGGGPYDELRGLAVDAGGRLYVANAYKKGSAVDVFSATINGDGWSRDYLGTLITPKDSKALLHPYGVAFDGKNLFVSSQDTNVVSSYAISGKKMPKAKTQPVAPYLMKLNKKGGYYDGTFVASADPVTVGKKKPQTPPAVDPKDGGLSMEGFDPQTVEQEPHTADASDEALPAKQQARHSVRGIAFAGKRLYVADQAKDRVGVYGHKSGTFHGWIDATADTSANPNAMDKPVGIAVNPANGQIYVGSPKNEAIFAYDPSTSVLSLVISSATSSTTGHLPSAADALQDLSGLSFTPDGSTLIFGSRKQMQLYALNLATGELANFGAQLEDAPECVLVVSL